MERRGGSHDGFSPPYGAAALMPRLHALELVPDDAGDHAVRRDWRALHDAGLASQLDHPAATNTPHVTVLADW